MGAFNYNNPFTRPCNTYVASSVGSPQMNLYDRNAWLGLAGASSIPKEAQTIGIRPVNVRKSNTGIPAEVSYCEPLGSETVVHLKSGQQEITALWEAETAGSLLRRQSITVSFPNEKLHFFDASGKRL